MFSILLGFSLLSFNLFTGPTPVPTPVKQHVLAEHEISLDKRYNNAFVNKVFKDNMLLTLEYMDNRVLNPQSISWNLVEKPGKYTFTINPATTFAFHDTVRKQFEPTLSRTTNAHFNNQEGFLYDGDLYGDGVCHLASLIYWAAKDAKLDAIAPTPHNFAVIPEIPKEYGVAIYTEKGQTEASMEQNLYITNTLKNPVTFTFNYAQNSNLSVTVTED